VVKVQNLALFYEKRVPLLKDLNFRLERGRVYALVGPNGSGKTTLLRALSGLMSFETGKIEWSETGRRPYLLQCQDGGFLPRLTGAQNLWFFAALFGISKPEFQKKLDHLEKSLDLEFILNKPFEKLSSGMAQFLSLMRAFLVGGDVLFFDEPTQSLDPEMRNRFWELLQKESPEKCIVFSTHRKEEASFLNVSILKIQNHTILTNAHPILKGVRGGALA